MNANILILDNYDSFTYNLVHAIRKLGYPQVEVIRNDQIATEEVERFDKIILSPGPGIPSEAGILLPLIARYAPSKKILGVCLGHQAIAESFGAILENTDEVYHGISSPVHIIEPDPIFYKIPNTFEAGRYHSWIVSNNGLPSCLRITAISDEGIIMALRHKEFDVWGVQFHPESVLTPMGEQIILNWLNL
ncbi:MAG: anthranilate synthase component II [Microbacter sp.]